MATTLKEFAPRGSKFFPLKVIFGKGGNYFQVSDLLWRSIQLNLFKWSSSLRKEFAPRESKFFPLRVAPYENE